MWLIFLFSFVPLHALTIPDKAIRDKLYGEAVKPNEFVDFLVEYIDDFLVHNGLDPLELPEVHRNFSHKPFLINYHGEFDLTQGWLHDTSTMQRAGNISLIYNFNDDRFEAHIPISFQDLLFSYNYKVKLMNMGPSGEITGNVSHVMVKLLVSYNNATYFKLHDFDILDTGRISLRFLGHGLVDWLVDFLSDTITFILHPIILKVVQESIRPHVDDLINIINEILAHRPGKFIYINKCFINNK